MPNKLELKNKRFGKLTVISFAGKRGTRMAWLCKCDCGKETIVQANNLGRTISCGCFRANRLANEKHSTKHGMYGTKTYNSWRCMISRCVYSKDKSFALYGGRGIRVCDSWLKFENFFRDMGLRPRETEIDRIDVNGNYEPLNCRWATEKIQANNRRNTVYLTVDGKTLPVSMWAKISGLHRSTIRRRIIRGITGAAALSRKGN